MRIPRSFEIMGMTVLIQIDSTLMNRCGCFGQAVFGEHKIYLQKQDGNFSKEAQYLTYLHERNHFFMYAMGEMDLNANEKFIDMLANLILQHEKTAKFKK